MARLAQSDQAVPSQLRVSNQIAAQLQQQTAFSSSLTCRNKMPQNTVRVSIMVEQ
jgi:hypothetical protein